MRDWVSFYCTKLNRSDNINKGNSLKREINETQSAPTLANSVVGFSNYGGLSQMMRLILARPDDTSSRVKFVRLTILLSSLYSRTIER